MTRQWNLSLHRVRGAQLDRLARSAGKDKSDLIDHWIRAELRRAPARVDGSPAITPDGIAVRTLRQGTERFLSVRIDGNAPTLFRVIPDSAPTGIESGSHLQLLAALLRTNGTGSAGGTAVGAFGGVLIVHRQGRGFVIQQSTKDRDSMREKISKVTLTTALLEDFGEAIEDALRQVGGMIEIEPRAGVDDCFELFDLASGSDANSE
ncbi:hypothetical protein H0I76_18615 [Limibaculum sp. M0105]|uniref:Uncharacterized protein n=2 Tax=Thermohalobaculum xanthum TaxID=2753746 RepID=A0A8J7SI78_9RHOB|nr:hypothetical protein [Thermohalobaculum xanthum]